MADEQKELTQSLLAGINNMNQINERILGLTTSYDALYQNKSVSTIQHSVQQSVDALKALANKGFDTEQNPKGAKDTEVNRIKALDDATELKEIIDNKTNEDKYNNFEVKEAALRTLLRTQSLTSSERKDFEDRLAFILKKQQENKNEQSRLENVVKLLESFEDANTSDEDKYNIASQLASIGYANKDIQDTLLDFLEKQREEFKKEVTDNIFNVSDSDYDSLKKALDDSDLGYSKAKQELEDAKNDSSSNKLDRYAQSQLKNIIDGTDDLSSQLKTLNEQLLTGLDENGKVMSSVKKALVADKIKELANQRELSFANSLKRLSEQTGKSIEELKKIKIEALDQRTLTDEYSRNNKYKSQARRSVDSMNVSAGSDKNNNFTLNYDELARQLSSEVANSMKSFDYELELKPGEFVNIQNAIDNDFKNIDNRVDFEKIKSAINNKLEDAYSFQEQREQMLADLRGKIYEDDYKYLEDLLKRRRQKLDRDQKSILKKIEDADKAGIGALERFKNKLKELRESIDKLNFSGLLDKSQEGQSSYIENLRKMRQITNLSAQDNAVLDASVQKTLNDLHHQMSLEDLRNIAKDLKSLGVATSKLATYSDALAKLQNSTGMDAGHVGELIKASNRMHDTQGEMIKTFSNLVNAVRDSGKLINTSLEDFGKDMNDMTPVFERLSHGNKKSFQKLMQAYGETRAALDKYAGGAIGQIMQQTLKDVFKASDIGELQGAVSHFISPERFDRIKRAEAAGDVETVKEAMADITMDIVQQADWIATLGPGAPGAEGISEEQQLQLRMLAEQLRGMSQEDKNDYVAEMVDSIKNSGLGDISIATDAANERNSMVGLMQKLGNWLGSTDLAVGVKQFFGMTGVTLDDMYAMVNRGFAMLELAILSKNLDMTKVVDKLKEVGTFISKIPAIGTLFGKFGNAVAAVLTKLHFFTGAISATAAPIFTLVAAVVAAGKALFGFFEGFSKSKEILGSDGFFASVASGLIVAFDQIVDTLITIPRMILNAIGFNFGNFDFAEQFFSSIFGDKKAQQHTQQMKDYDEQHYSPTAPPQIIAVQGAELPETAIPQHEAGLSFVPADNYLASLHKGEAVIPASQAEGLRNAVKSDGGIPIQTDVNKLPVSEMPDTPIEIQAKLPKSREAIINATKLADSNDGSIPKEQLKYYKDIKESLSSLPDEDQQRALRDAYKQLGNNTDPSLMAKVVSDKVKAIDMSNTKVELEDKSVKRSFNDMFNKVASTEVKRNLDTTDPKKISEAQTQLAKDFKEKAAEVAELGEKAREKYSDSEIKMLTQFSKLSDADQFAYVKDMVDLNKNEVGDERNTIFRQVLNRMGYLEPMVKTLNEFYRGYKKIMAGVSDSWNKIKDSIGDIFDTLYNIFYPLIRPFKKLFGPSSSNVSYMLEGIKLALKPVAWIAKRLFDWAVPKLVTILEFIGSVIEVVSDAIESVSKFLNDKFGDKQKHDADKIVEAVQQGSMDDIMKNSKFVSEDVKKMLISEDPLEVNKARQLAFDELQKTYQSGNPEFVDSVSDDLRKNFEIVAKLDDSHKEAMYDDMKGASEWFVGSVGLVIDGLLLLTGIKFYKAFISPAETAGQAVGNVASALSSTFTKIIKKVLDFGTTIGKLTTKIKSSPLVEPIIKVFTSTVSFIKDKLFSPVFSLVKSLFNFIWSGIKNNSLIGSQATKLETKLKEKFENFNPKEILSNLKDKIFNKKGSENKEEVPKLPEVQQDDIKDEVIIKAKTVNVYGAGNQLDEPSTIQQGTNLIEPNQPNVQNVGQTIQQDVGTPVNQPNVTQATNEVLQRQDQHTVQSNIQLPTTSSATKQSNIQNTILPSQSLEQPNVTGQVKPWNIDALPHVSTQQLTTSGVQPISATGITTSQQISQQHEISLKTLNQSEQRLNEEREKQYKQNVQQRRQQLDQQHTEVFRHLERANKDFQTNYGDLFNKLINGLSAITNKFLTNTSTLVRQGDSTARFVDTRSTQSVIRNDTHREVNQQINQQRHIQNTTDTINSSTLSQTRSRRSKLSFITDYADTALAVAGMTAGLNDSTTSTAQSALDVANAAADIKDTASTVTKTSTDVAKAGAETANLAGKSSGLLSKVGGTLVKGVTKFGGPLAVIGTAVDFVSGAMKSEELLGSDSVGAKISTGIGTFIGGEGEGGAEQALSQALKLGMAGSMFGPVGMAAGALVGLVGGYIGGDNIAKGLYSVGGGEVLSTNVPSTDVGVTVEGSHELGLDYVPHDNYIASLHKGEAVLTAEQAESLRSVGLTNVAHEDILSHIIKVIELSVATEFSNVTSTDFAKESSLRMASHGDNLSSNVGTTELYGTGGQEFQQTVPLLPQGYARVEGSFSHGGTVPVTGLYVLSAGEQVIPTIHPESDAVREQTLISDLTSAYPGIPIKGNYAEGSGESTGILSSIASAFTSLFSGNTAAAKTSGSSMSSSTIAAGSYGAGAISTSSIPSVTSSSDGSALASASVANTALTNDILSGYTRGFSRYAANSMKTMSKEPGILIKGYATIQEGSTKAIVAAIANPEATKEALSNSEDGLISRFVSWITGKDDKVDNHDSNIATNANAVTTAKGSVESYGNTNNMNEAEQKAWKAAMIVGSKTGLPPELFYAQFIHESGRTNDWHYQDNNLGGVKFANQSGAVAGAAAPSQEGGSTYAKFNTIEDYANYYADNLLGRDFGDVLQRVQTMATQGASKEDIIKAYAYELGNTGYYTNVSGGAATEQDKANYYSDMLSISKEAPTDYKIKPLSDGSVPVTLQNPQDIKQDFQGLDEAYLDLSYAKQDLQRTNLENLQPVVKQVMNSMAKEIYERTGVKPVITGGAETHVHAAGEYGHHGGWKIDIDPTGIDSNVMTEVATKYGVAVGDEGNHYDIAFSQHGGGVGGTQLTQSSVGTYDKGTLSLPSTGQGSPFPNQKIAQLKELANQMRTDHDMIPMGGHPGEAVLPHGATQALMEILNERKRRPKRPMNLEGKVSGKRRKDPHKSDMYTGSSGSVSASIAGMTVSGGSGGGSISIGNAAGPISQSGIVAPMSVGAGGTTHSASLPMGVAATTVSNLNGPGSALDWKKIADTYLGGKWVSNLSGSKQGSVGCADFTSNALTSLGLDIGAVPSVEELQKRLASMGFELKVNPNDMDLEEGDVLGYLGNVDYSKVDWRNPDLSGNTEGSATAGHIGLVGPGGASLQNSSGFSDDKAAPMMTGSAKDIVGDNWGTNKTLLIKTSKFFKSSGMTANDLAGYLQSQGIRIGGSELAEDSTLAGSTKAYTPSTTETNFLPMVPNITSSAVTASTNNSASAIPTVSDTITKGLQTSSTPTTPSVDISSLGPMANVALAASARLKERGININPSMLWAQMQHETGGDAKYQEAVQKYLGGVDDHNYGGFTWYEGMGEQYKGIARPAAEGGYYAKFSSDQDYATHWADKVLGNGTFDINNKNTAEDYASALANGQDGAKYYLGETPEQYAAGMKMAMEGKESQLAALDAMVGQGVTSIGNTAVAGASTATSAVAQSGNPMTAAISAGANAVNGITSGSFTMPSMGASSANIGGGSVSSSAKIDKKNPVASGAIQTAANTKALIGVTSKGFGGINKGLGQQIKATYKTSNALGQGFGKGLSSLAGVVGSLKGGGTSFGGMGAATLGNASQMKIGSKVAGTSGAVGGNTNEEKIWSFLKSKGLTDEQAAGVMGNLQQESNFESNIVQGGGHANEITVDGVTGYGIAQWTTADRQQALVDFAKAKGKSTSDLMTQLEFMYEEAVKRGDWAKLLQATTAADATFAWHRDFERSADSYDAVVNGRGGYAQEILNKHRGKTYAPQGGISSGGATPATAGKLTTFSMQDDRWADMSAGMVSRIGSNGCTIVAGSMVLSRATGVEITPDQLAMDYVNGGSSIDAMLAAHGYQGDWREVTSNKAAIDAQLDSGQSVYWYYQGAPNKYTKSGNHAIVIAGRDANGNYIVQDPNGGQVSSDTWEGLTSYSSGTAEAIIRTAQLGEWYVPEDEALYRLHEGEMVLPPEQAEHIRQVLDSGVGKLDLNGTLPSVQPIADVLSDNSQVRLADSANQVTLASTEQQLPDIAKTNPLTLASQSQLTVPAISTVSAVSEPVTDYATLLSTIVTLLTDIRNNTSIDSESKAVSDMKKAVSNQSVIGVTSSGTRDQTKIELGNAKSKVVNDVKVGKLPEVVTSYKNQPSVSKNQELPKVDSTVKEIKTASELPVIKTASPVTIDKTQLPEKVVPPVDKTETASNIVSSNVVETVKAPLDNILKPHSSDYYKKKMEEAPEKGDFFHHSKQYYEAKYKKALQDEGTLTTVTAESFDLEPPKNPLDDFKGGEYFNRTDKVADIVREYMKKDTTITQDDIMKELGIESREQALAAEQQQKLGFRDYDKIRTMEHFDVDTKLAKSLDSENLAVDDWIKASPEIEVNQKKFDELYDKQLEDYNIKLKEYQNSLAVSDTKDISGSAETFKTSTQQPTGTKIESSNVTRAINKVHDKVAVTKDIKSSVDSSNVTESSSAATTTKVDKKESAELKIDEVALEKLKFDKNDIDYLTKQTWVKDEKQAKQYLIANSDKYKKQLQEQTKPEIDKAKIIENIKFDQNDIDYLKQFEWLGKDETKIKEYLIAHSDKYKEAFADSKKSLESAISKQVSKDTPISTMPDVNKSTVQDQDSTNWSNRKMDVVPPSIKDIFNNINLGSVSKSLPDLINNTVGNLFNLGNAGSDVGNAGNLGNLFSNVFGSLFNKKSADKPKNIFGSLFDNLFGDLFGSKQKSPLDIAITGCFGDIKASDVEKQFKDSSKQVKSNISVEDSIKNLVDTIIKPSQDLASDYYNIFKSAYSDDSDKFKDAASKILKTTVTNLPVQDVLDNLIVADSNLESIRNVMSDKMLSSKVEVDDKAISSTKPENIKIEPPKNSLDDFKGGEYFNRTDKVINIVREYMKKDSNITQDDIMKELGIESRDQVLTAEQQQKLGFRDYDKIRTMEHFDVDTKLAKSLDKETLGVDDWIKASPEIEVNQKKFDESYDKQLEEYNKTLKANAAIDTSDKLSSDVYAEAQKWLEKAKIAPEQGDFFHHSKTYVQKQLTNMLSTELNLDQKNIDKMIQDVIIDGKFDSEKLQVKLKELDDNNQLKTKQQAVEEINKTASQQDLLNYINKFTETYSEITGISLPDMTKIIESSIKDNKIDGNLLQDTVEKFKKVTESTTDQIKQTQVVKDSLVNQQSMQLEKTTEDIKKQVNQQNEQQMVNTSKINKTVTDSNKIAAIENQTAIKDIVRNKMVLLNESSEQISKHLKDDTLEKTIQLQADVSEGSETLSPEEQLRIDSIRNSLYEYNKVNKNEDTLNTQYAKVDALVKQMKTDNVSYDDMKKVLVTDEYSQTRDYINNQLQFEKFADQEIARSQFTDTKLHRINDEAELRRRFEENLSRYNSSNETEQKLDTTVVQLKKLEPVSANNLGSSDVISQNIKDSVTTTEQQLESVGQNIKMSDNNGNISVDTHEVNPTTRSIQELNSTAVINKLTNNYPEMILDGQKPKFINTIKYKGDDFYKAIYPDMRIKLIKKNADDETKLSVDDAATITANVGSEHVTSASSVLLDSNTSTGISNTVPSGTISNSSNLSDLNMMTHGFVSGDKKYTQIPLDDLTLDETLVPNISFNGNLLQGITDLFTNISKPHSSDYYGDKLSSASDKGSFFQHSKQYYAEKYIDTLKRENKIDQSISSSDIIKKLDNKELTVENINSLIKDSVKSVDKVDSDVKKLDRSANPDVKSEVYKVTSNDIDYLKQFDWFNKMTPEQQIDYIKATLPGEVEVAPELLKTNEVTTEQVSTIDEASGKPVAEHAMSSSTVNNDSGRQIASDVVETKVRELPQISRQAEQAKNSSAVTTVKPEQSGSISDVVETLKWAVSVIENKSDEIISAIKSSKDMRPYTGDNSKRPYGGTPFSDAMF